MDDMQREWLVEIAYRVLPGRNFYQVCAASEDEAIRAALARDMTEFGFMNTGAYSAGVRELEPVRAEHFG